MPRYKRIRVRGRPRLDIDIDLLAQALIMASQDMQEPAPGTADLPDAEPSDPLPVDESPHE